LQKFGQCNILRLKRRTLGPMPPSPVNVDSLNSESQEDLEIVAITEGLGKFVAKCLLQSEADRPDSATCVKEISIRFITHSDRGECYGHVEASDRGSFYGEGETRDRGSFRDTASVKLTSPMKTLESFDVMSEKGGTRRNPSFIDLEIAEALSADVKKNISLARRSKVLTANAKQENNSTVRI
jgi:hypothetical protein